ncbi:alpha-crystallin B chain-like [Haliotis rufescens]|uniref:alpha-crystallin B chain-like n=1 Tax=Haliotis rufescens TaxID=6454 RepID=UPI00201F3A58|nr:alpha-crystallin B chain-like [Haliotis rufescens]
MSLIRQVPVSWDAPTSWNRQGWNMDYFNPERQLGMLDREMRDMNLRSGLRDMNMSSDNRISNFRSGFDNWAPYPRSSSSFQPSMPMMTMPSFDGDFQYSLRHMDREMKRMTEEMNRMFSHCQHLVPVDSQPETWRTRENFLLENPIVHDHQGGKKFQLQFDVRQFKPEEIMVKTADKQLSVHARHEEKGDNKSVFREYHRQFMLPTNINPESLVSKLTRDGLLSIEAPLPALEESPKLIPIEHN